MDKYAIFISVWILFLVLVLMCFRSDVAVLE